MDVAVGDAGGLALAAKGDEVAEGAGVREQRFPKAIPRKKELNGAR